MADQVGGEELESKTNELEKVNSSYRVVFFGGSTLKGEMKNLVLAPFLNSLRYGNDLFKLIDRDAYFFNYSKYIDVLLNRPMSLVRIAMLDDDTALGWSLSEYKTVHYVWVKKELRRQGIGRSLMPDDFDTITHITNVGINIWVNKYPEVKFDPYK